MKPEISIILPGIRANLWDTFYDSIIKSTNRTFELIIISPFPLTSKLQELVNVKYIKSLASPIAASQMGALLAVGKLILWGADDAIFLDKALDNNVDLLYSQGDNYKNVVVAKYYEGINGSQKPLQPDSYFKINGSSWTASQYINNDWWIFNVAVMYRSFFEELGGWDCGFESCPLSHTDLAIRSYHAGAKVIMSKFPMLDCDHSQSDHFAVESAMIQHDSIFYNNKIKSKELGESDIKININNWKDSPSIWKRRFQMNKVQ